MSKKKRKRPNLPEVTLRRYGPGGSSEDTARARTRPRDDFDPDYSHVAKDLRRIAVLAVSLISILVALSFFLG